MTAASKITRTDLSGRGRGSSRVRRHYLRVNTQQATDAHLQWNGKPV